MDNCTNTIFMLQPNVTNLTPNALVIAAIKNTTLLYCVVLAWLWKAEVWIASAWGEVVTVFQIDVTERQQATTL